MLAAIKIVHKLCHFLFNLWCKICTGKYSRIRLEFKSVALPSSFTWSCVVLNSFEPGLRLCVQRRLRSAFSSAQSDQSSQGIMWVAREFKSSLDAHTKLTRDWRIQNRQWLVRDFFVFQLYLRSSILICDPPIDGRLPHLETWLSLKLALWRKFKKPPKPHPLTPDFERNGDFELTGVLLTFCMAHPADTWRLKNVASTSMQRHDVASTLRRRCINVMCPLGRFAAGIFLLPYLFIYSGNIKICTYPYI